MTDKVARTKPSHSIYIISGGVGASGDQLVHTVLAQYPGNRVQVTTFPNVHFPLQLDQIIERASEENATLVHTLVDSQLRAYLISAASERGVFSIDLMGPLFDRLNDIQDDLPVGKPGLYRQLNKAYFDRIAAIEYTMAHDDGKHPEGWDQAEIVLAGVSRAGKTPLSLYLSVLGWKVANVPLVPGLNLSQELFQIDPQRVIGLKIDVVQVLVFRQQRQLRLGVSGPSDYTNPEKIYEELKYAEEIFKRGGFTTITVTDKPIESSADEVIRLIANQTSTRSRSG